MVDLSQIAPLFPRFGCVNRVVASLCGRELAWAELARARPLGVVWRFFARCRHFFTVLRDRPVRPAISRMDTCSRKVQRPMARHSMSPRLSLLGFSALKMSRVEFYVGQS